jgi:hypothetical protein
VNNRTPKTPPKKPIKHIKRESIRPEQTSFLKEFIWRGPRKCKFCDNIEEKRGNMKNHTLNHFKEPLNSITPPDSLVKPFPCPIPSCEGKEHRDKITFQRHFGFGHRKIYEFCSDEDLLGDEITGECINSTKNTTTDITTPIQKRSGTDVKKSNAKKQKVKLKEEAVSMNAQTVSLPFDESIVQPNDIVQNQKQSLEESLDSQYVGHSVK